MTSQATPAELARVFALQQAHQWDVKASTAAERKAKLAKLKDAVDPNGVLSPGRHGIWPSRYGTKHRRHS